MAQAGVFYGAGAGRSWERDIFHTAEEDSLSHLVVRRLQCPREHASDWRGVKQNCFQFSGLQQQAHLSRFACEVKETRGTLLLTKE